MSEKSAYDWDTLGSFSDELIKIPDTADCTGTIRPGQFLQYGFALVSSYNTDLGLGHGVTLV